MDFLPCRVPVIGTFTENGTSHPWKGLYDVVTTVNLIVFDVLVLLEVTDNGGDNDSRWLRIEAY